jgi:hypothetical protein
MMANPFSVNVVNPLEALMQGEQGFATSRGYMDERTKRAAREEAAQSVMQGGDTRGALARLLSVGDLQGAQTIASLDQTQKLGERDARDFAFRTGEAHRAQTNADRSFGMQERQFNATLNGGRVPAGFEVNPAGGLRPVAGGPEDPNYLRSKTSATEKARPMSITDITKLSDEGQKFSDLTRFQDTFKPEFAGYGSPTAGNLANTIGRNLPESVSRMVGKDLPESASWWQGYDRYKNVVRHDLYGSALTKPETEAFERADITPGMQPDQIKKNLKLQKEIVENGLKRKASAMVQAGYDPAAIGKAYGIDLGAVGVDTQGRRGTPSAGTTPAAGAAQTWKDPATGKDYIVRDGKLFAQ